MGAGPSGGTPQGGCAAVAGRPVRCETPLPGLRPPPRQSEKAPRGRALQQRGKKKSARSGAGRVALQPVAPRKPAGTCSSDPGLAATSRELVERAFADGLHSVEGWLDMGQVADAVDELVCAVWRGDTSINEVARVEVFRRLNWKADELLEEAAVVKGFWEEAKFQANQGGNDFVQQAGGLSRGLPEAEAWQA